MRFTRCLLAVGIVALGAGGLALPGTQEAIVVAAEATEAPLAERLQGTWILVGTPDKVGEVPKSGGRLKFYTGKCWCITQPDAETGIVKFHHGGTYTLDGNRMKSVVDYAGASTAERLHTTSNFEIKVDGDTYTQIGLDNPYSEVWKRVK